MGKFSIAVAALAATAAAFPAVRGPEAKRLERRQAQLERVAKRDGYHSGKGTVPDTLAVFDAKSQYISNQGKYKFVPPGPTDQRGPCPGLNAMANHNYLPHNGIATITQYIEATNKVYGMGLDLGGFLSVYGAIFNGDLLKFSMGGPDPRVSLGLLGFDKQPIGLSGSHNNYESDVSPIRGDLYQYGDGYTNQVEQFAQLWAYQDELSNEESNFNLEILQDFRSKRWDDSLYKNPDFFSAIFAGVLVQPAAFTFMYRFLANHSAEYPDGQLTQNILKEFWAISGPDESGKFTNKHGWERIPDNWYRRTIGDDYTIPFFLLDVIQEATVYPKFLSLGGNVNGTNTFVGVDPGDLTKGVFNAKNLLEGNNLQCFIFQFLFQDAPDFLFGLGNDVTHAVTLLTNAISNATVGLDCPQLEKAQITDQFDKFPGYTKSKGMGRPEGPLTGLVSGLGSILGGGH